MRISICSSLAFLVFGILAQAQSIDPIDILRKADSACRLVQTASYSAELYKGYDGRRLFTASGDITLRRMKDQGGLGAAVRIEVEQVSNAAKMAGTIYAYDGITVQCLSPTSKEVLIGEPEQVGSQLIASNWLRRFIETPLNGDAALADAINRGERFGYEGVDTIGAISCHVILIELSATEHLPGKRIRWYIGTDDNLPRRQDVLMTYNGVQQEEHLTLRDLDVNRIQHDSIFSIPIPDEYEVVIYQRHKPLLAVGTTAPMWILPDRDGNSLSLSDLRGRVVLLDFWFTTCPPCRKAMPMLQHLHERFAERGVAVYGINLWSADSAGAVRLMQQKGYTYGLLTNGHSVAEDYQVVGFPTFYLIGDDGTIIYRGGGYGEGKEEELAGIIEKYLHERGR